VELNLVGIMSWVSFELMVNKVRTENRM